MKKIAKLLLTLASVAMMASCGETPASSAAPSSTTPTSDKASETPAASSEKASEAPAASSETPAESSTDEDPRKKWSAYDTEWLSEDFTTKEIAYQFSGTWELADYGFYYTLCLNLYTDQSARLEIRNTHGLSSNYCFGYYGYDTEDEKLDIVITKEANGDKCDAFKNAYESYESIEAKGEFGGFSISFHIVPGQTYTRQSDLTQRTGDAIWATDAAFHTAVDVLEISNYYASEAGDAKVWVWSDGVALAYYYYNGMQVGHLDGQTGVRQDDSGEYIHTITFGEQVVDLVAGEDEKVSFSITFDLAGTPVTSKVTEADIPTEGNPDHPTAA